MNTLTLETMLEEIAMKATGMITVQGQAGKWSAMVPSPRNDATHEFGEGARPYDAIRQLHQKIVG